VTNAIALAYTARTVFILEWVNGKYFVVVPICGGVAAVDNCM